MQTKNLKDYERVELLIGDKIYVVILPPNNVNEGSRIKKERDKIKARAE